MSPVLDRWKKTWRHNGHKHKKSLQVIWPKRWWIELPHPFSWTRVEEKKGGVWKALPARSAFRAIPRIHISVNVTQSFATRERVYWPSGLTGKVGVKGGVLMCEWSESHRVSLSDLTHFRYLPPLQILLKRYTYDSLKSTLKYEYHHCEQRIFWTLSFILTNVKQADSD